MSDKAHREPYFELKTVKPGDRVLRIRTRKRRLPLIRRRIGGPVSAAIDLFTDIFTQTAILPIMGILALLVILVPIPLFLIERSADDAQMTSYWIGLWWAVSAFSTAGHSDVVLLTGAGRVVGSIYTVLAVGLFFGSVLAAFSSYFMLTWRRPKRMIIDSINYYLQRIDQLTGDEIEELEEITAGLLHTAKERAEVEHGHSTPDEEPLRAEP